MSVHLGRITIRAHNGVGIMNAACGQSGSEEGVKRLYNSGMSAVVVKTSTLEPRTTPDKIHLRDEIGSLNVYGLENPGLENVLHYDANDSSIPCIFSVSCTPAEVDAVVKTLASRFFEVNVSCPNVKIGCSQFDYIGRVMHKLSLHKISINGFGVKLPLFFNESDVQSVVEIFKCTITPDYVVCGNTLPGVMMDGHTPVIGAIGGKYLTPFALNNVRMLSSALKSAGLHTKVVGCGGISCGKDIHAFVKCGAVAVQLATNLEGGSNLMKLVVEYGNEILNQCKL